MSSNKREDSARSQSIKEKQYKEGEGWMTWDERGMQEFEKYSVDSQRPEEVESWRELSKCWVRVVREAEGEDKPLEKGGEAKTWKTSESV